MFNSAFGVCFPKALFLKRQREKNCLFHDFVHQIVEVGNDIINVFAII